MASGLLSPADKPADVKKQVVAALGSLLVPSRPADPGYADLESHGITDYVIEDLRASDEVVAAFNQLSNRVRVEHRAAAGGLAVHARGVDGHTRKCAGQSAAIRAQH